jgi:hypothetical protein
VKGIFDVNAGVYSERGIPFLRILNLRHGSIDESGLVFIPKELHKEEIKTELRRGDIVLSKTAYPAVSLVTLDQCNTSQDTIATTLSNYGREHYRPEAIVAYLNSRIGQTLLWRQFQGNVQLHLSLDDGRKVPIPRFGIALQDKIASLFRQSEAARNAAKLALKEADSVLLAALRLDTWQPPETLTYVRSSRDAFAAGRLDAEHFQERFYAAKQALKNAGAKRFIPLPALLKSLTNGHTPLRHDLTIGEVPFLCAEHVTDFNISFDSDKRILLEHHEEELARTHVANGDVLLTIKGRIGNAAIVENVPKAVNINQDVALLRFNRDLPLWYVVAYLNSRFGKLQSEKMATGAINPFLGLFTLRQFEVPEFDHEVMQDIADRTSANVVSARQAKQRAAQFLDAAKRAVEIAIEIDEGAALDYLNQAREVYHDGNS